MPAVPQVLEVAVRRANVHVSRPVSTFWEGVVCTLVDTYRMPWSPMRQRLANVAVELDELATDGCPAAALKALDKVEELGAIARALGKPHELGAIAAKRRNH